MKKGILHKTETGWVVTYDPKTKKSDSVLFETPVLKNLDIDENSISELKPTLDNVEYWHSKTIQFEVVKKFLADKTVYLAKIIQPKIVLSWDNIYDEWLNDTSKDLFEYLKENYKPPTRK